MKTNPVKSLRQFSRIPFDADVLLILPDKTLTVHLIDIALKGALVQTSEQQSLVLHEKCRLEFSLTEVVDPIVMVGQIVHLNKQHVGIECLDIDIVSLTSLRRIIELNTGDPERINRELSHLFAST